MKNELERSLRACSDTDCMACPRRVRCRQEGPRHLLMEAANKLASREERCAELERMLAEREAKHAQQAMEREAYEEQIKCMTAAAEHAESLARGYRMACMILEDLLRGGNGNGIQNS